MQKRATPPRPSLVSATHPFEASSTSHSPTHVLLLFLCTFSSFRRRCERSKKPEGEDKNGETSSEWKRSRWVNALRRARVRSSRGNHNKNYWGIMNINLMKPLVVLHWRAIDGNILHFQPHAMGNDEEEAASKGAATARAKMWKLWKERKYWLMGAHGCWGGVRGICRKKVRSSVSQVHVRFIDYTKSLTLNTVSRHRQTRLLPIPIWWSPFPHLLFIGGVVCLFCTRKQFIRTGNCFKSCRFAPLFFHAKKLSSDIQFTFAMLPKHWTSP